MEVLGLTEGDDHDGASVRYILDAARAAGMSCVQLWIARENTAARRLYENIGMKLTSTRQVDEATEWVRYGMRLCSNQINFESAARE